MTRESELRKAYGYTKADGVMLEELTPGELMRAYCDVVERYRRLEKEKNEAVLNNTPRTQTLGQA